MQNKIEILQNIHQNILNISDVEINIYIEEINEIQSEYYYIKKEINKKIKNYGCNITIKTQKDLNFKSFSFFNYFEFSNLVKNILEKQLNYKFKKTNNIKTSIKNIKQKKYKLSNTKKIRIYNYIKKKLHYVDELKLSFYETKENIYILNNKNISIINIKNFYSKIMLYSSYNNIESFDHMLFNNGYKGLNESKLINFIKNYNYYNYIKYNSSKFIEGEYDIILSNKCGTVFHEIFGHNLEEDLICFNGNFFKSNKNIGNDLVTYIDNPRLKNLLNIPYNCYGQKRIEKTLIKKGVVKNYLTKDSLRCENYKYMPCTRMSNSYLKPLKNNVKIDVKNLNKVIFIEKIKNGRLFIEARKFKIEVDCAIYYEKGLIKAYYSNFSFILDVEDFIKKIKIIENDLNFISTVCGAKSGNIFVYSGSPTVLVKNINIIQKK